jgi:glycine/D-amino acid oxidase-like deaminating enzyme
VVLAGGAWSRLFCGNAGVDLPQLREITAGGSVFEFRKRLDGGYTIARRNANVADITPDSFRLLLRYLPTLKQNYGEIRLRFGRALLRGVAHEARWALDEATPFEAARVLDPAPKQATLEGAREALWHAFPVFARMQVAESWGGLIDVTPDAVPVIGEEASIPGFFLATGFSGHGFDIGPGAGRLAADLVAGDTPIVDPRPFRFSRFTEGRGRTTS